MNKINIKFLRKNRKRKYKRISYEQRQELIQLVLTDGKKINEAAKLLKIRYAAAKSVIAFSKQKKNRQQKDKYKHAKRAQYRQILGQESNQNNNSILKYSIICMLSEQLITEQEYQLCIN